jgi:transcriptional regulator with XRE-family HTH domain
MRFWTYSWIRCVTTLLVLNFLFKNISARAGNFPSSLIGLAKCAMFFNVDIMQSHELLREVFQKCSAKQVASELGLSLSMIYKWAEADDGSGSGSANPLDRIEALLRCSNDNRIVQWICQRAGGFFILNPKTNKPHPSFLIPATNEIVQEFADLLAVIATAAADNQITPREAATIRARWEELKCVTEGFVTCCEEGNFSALKEKSTGVSPA